MNRRAQTGFTLIEVLVSVVVFAIGLLGLAAMQAISMRNNYDASLRTYATIAAYDIIDRMQANQRGLQNHAYHRNATAAGAEISACKTIVLDINAGTAQGCTAAQLANHDIAQWRAHLAQSLTNGEGVVCIDNTPEDGTDSSTANDGCPATPPAGAYRVVKVWWSERDIYNEDSDASTDTVKRRFIVSAAF